MCLLYSKGKPIASHKNHLTKSYIPSEIRTVRYVYIYVQIHMYI